MEQIRQYVFSIFLISFVCGIVLLLAPDGNGRKLKKPTQFLTALCILLALKNLNVNARAPHAYLPMLLCDNVPNERAIALKFGIELLERSDVLLVCGNRISNGMKSEIANAAMLRMPIIVFDDMLYLEVQKLVTQKNGDKKTVKLDSNHIPMSLSNPISYMEQAAMFK